MHTHRHVHTHINSVTVNAMMPENQSSVMKSSVKKRYLSQDLILPALMPSFLIYKIELTMVASIALLRIKLDNDGIRFTRVSSK